MAVPRPQEWICGGAIFFVLNIYDWRHATSEAAAREDQHEDVNFKNHFCLIMNYVVICFHVIVVRCVYVKCMRIGGGDYLRVLESTGLVAGSVRSISRAGSSPGGNSPSTIKVMSGNLLEHYGHT